MGRALVAVGFGWVLSCGMSAVSLAHDTTHIHPLITDRIRILIQSTDSVDQAYDELYKLQGGTPVNWGEDPDIEYVPGQEDYSGFTRYTTVIDGVVQEDVPATKVRTHFHQADTGIPLTVVGIPVSFTSSQARATELFGQALHWYAGYTDESRSMAYFKFGQALHHVEDMTSPAHIHNDAHLVFLDAELDDYEGWYLPSKKAELAAHMSGSTIPPIDDPRVDIWGAAITDSLVAQIYRRTTYAATLQFPYGVGVYVGGQFPFWQGAWVAASEATPPAPPTGELAAMFPCPGGELAHPNCLHWEEDALSASAHWTINAVGDYHHQYSNGLRNAWWPVSEENAGLFPGTGEPDGVAALYYIEQLARGNGETAPLAGMVRPEAVRSEFNLPWSPGSNGMTGNVPDPDDPALRKPLLAYYAEHLLRPAVEYGAGYSHLWYDIANTPPYLRNVLLAQNSDAGDPGGIRYDARWEEVTRARTESITSVISALGSSSFIKSVPYAEAREMVLDNNTFTHIHARSALTLVLGFNEPIRDITQLTIGRVDTEGGCLEPQSACLDVLSLGLVPERSPEQNSWTYVIPAAAVDGLNGKLVVTVRAIDKNNHRDGNGGTAGAQLDDSPATPARRMTVAAAGGLPEHYPWQTAETPCDPGTPEGESGCYAYDYAQGDRNHYLLFDTSAPSGEIVVDTTL